MSNDVKPTPQTSVSTFISSIFTSQTVIKIAAALSVNARLPGSASKSIEPQNGTEFCLFEYNPHPTPHDDATRSQPLRQFLDICQENRNFPRQDQIGMLPARMATAEHFFPKSRPANRQDLIEMATAPRAAHKTASTLFKEVAEIIEMTMLRLRALRLTV